MLVAGKYAAGNCPATGASARIVPRNPPTNLSQVQRTSEPYDQLREAGRPAPLGGRAILHKRPVQQRTDYDAQLLEPLHFHAHAEVYDRARAPYPAALWQRLHSDGLLRRGTQVVELGAGTGLATGPMLQTDAIVIAVEPGPVLAARLRRRWPEAAIYIDSAETAPLPPSPSISPSSQQRRHARPVRTPIEGEQHCITDPDFGASPRRATASQRQPSRKLPSRHRADLGDGTLSSSPVEDTAALADAAFATALQAGAHEVTALSDNAFGQRCGRTARVETAVSDCRFRGDTGQDLTKSAVRLTLPAFGIGCADFPAFNSSRSQSRPPDDSAGRKRQ
jgi:hypothetical protein